MEVAEIESDEDAIHVTDDLLQFHNKLVLLLRYHELNFDGIYSPPCNKLIICIITITIVMDGVF